jgi:hypothetical protein
MWRLRICRKSSRSCEGCGPWRMRTPVLEEHEFLLLSEVVPPAQSRREVGVSRSDRQAWSPVSGHHLGRCLSYFATPNFSLRAASSRSAEESIIWAWLPVPTSTKGPRGPSGPAAVDSPRGPLDCPHSQTPPPGSGGPCGHAPSLCRAARRGSVAAHSDRLGIPQRAG